MVLEAATNPSMASSREGLLMERRQKVSRTVQDGAPEWSIILLLVLATFVGWTTSGWVLGGPNILERDGGTVLSSCKGLQPS